LDWPTGIRHPMTRQIDGILFDFGDTLVDFEDVDVMAKFEDGARSAYEYLEELNQPMPDFEKYHRQQLWAVRWRYSASFFTGRDFNALDLIDHLGDALGHDLTAEQIQELTRRWYWPLGESGTVEPGTREMIASLRDKGLKLGLISNTFVPAEVLDLHLETLGLIDLLPMRIYSCTLDFRKPDRRIFQMGLDAMDLEPARAMYVGNSLRYDVRGANRMGMISVLKHRHHRRRGIFVKPDHAIEHLMDLPSVVEQYV
jgi:FMN phosphatase YigB (HAD superfamily)